MNTDNLPPELESLKQCEAVPPELFDAVPNVFAEVAALRQQLANARGQALEEMAEFVFHFAHGDEASDAIRRMIAEQPHKHKFDSDGGSCSCGATVAELLEQPQKEGQDNV